MWTTFKNSIYNGITKKGFTISKKKTLNPRSPLHQCCKSREREKIKSYICFDNQQHWFVPPPFSVISLKTESKTLEMISLNWILLVYFKKLYCLSLFNMYRHRMSNIAFTSLATPFLRSANAISSWQNIL